MEPIAPDHHSNTHFCGAPIASYFVSSPHSKPAIRGLFACKSCKGRLVATITRLIVYNVNQPTSLSLADCRSSNFPSPELDAQLRRTLGLDSFPALVSIDKLWRKLVQHIAKETALSLMSAQIQSSATCQLKALFGDLVSESATQGSWEQDDGSAAWVWFRASLKRRQDGAKTKRTMINNVHDQPSPMPGASKPLEPKNDGNVSTDTNKHDVTDKTGVSDSDPWPSMERDLATLLGSLQLRLEAEKTEIDAQHAMTLAVANKHSAAQTKQAWTGLVAARGALSNEEEKTEDLVKALMQQTGELSSRGGGN